MKKALSLIFFLFAVFHYGEESFSFSLEHFVGLRKGCMNEYVFAFDENTEKSISTETDDFENVRGDIEADLQILRYFNSSRAKEIAESFQRILSGLSEMPLEEVVFAVREQEKLLTDCIVRTQTDIQQYRESISEK